MKFVVVGGGVAGVCCAEELCRLCPQSEVTLVSADKTLKGASVVARITPFIEEIHVEEKRLDDGKYPNMRFVLGAADHLDVAALALHLRDGRVIPYDRLCIATGSSPCVLPGTGSNPAVLTLRDTDSIADLASRLCCARRVAIVGNGGIALELVHSLRGMDVSWVVRHQHVGDAFFDADAAEFLLGMLQRERGSGGEAQGPTPSGARTSSLLAAAPRREDDLPPAAVPAASPLPSPASGSRVLGHAVGPTWVKQLAAAEGAQGRGLDVRLGREVVQVCSHAGWPVSLRLDDGTALHADVAVAALGVQPNTAWVRGLRRAADGGLAVDARLRTSTPEVWAAGDACSAGDLEAAGAHWFQMRLWTQARSQGIYAAHAMAGADEDTGASMAFELFTHVTSFAGHKVVLLGRYNGQGLDAEPESDLGNGGTFVRLLLLRGKVQGAVFIGETDLEEAIEHLIMDELDVGQYGPSLLDPEFELDHVFD